MTNWRHYSGALRAPLQVLKRSLGGQGYTTLRIMAFSITTLGLMAELLYVLYDAFGNNTFILNVVMLNVVMLNVLAPSIGPHHRLP
jgi:hypothetical protein